MRLLANIILTALVILGIPYILKGFVVDSFLTAMLVALALGFINITLRPILLLLTLPITLITLGLFTFVVNAFLLWLVAYFIPGFVISGFIEAFLGAFLITIGKWIIDKLLPED